MGGADGSDVMLNMNHLYSPAPLINVLPTTNCLLSLALFNTRADLK